MVPPTLDRWTFSRALERLELERDRRRPCARALRRRCGSAVRRVEEIPMAPPNTRQEAEKLDQGKGVVPYKA